jgi:hypothetical protein
MFKTALSTPHLKLSTLTAKMREIRTKKETRMTLREKKKRENIFKTRRREIQDRGGGNST